MKKVIITGANGALGTAVTNKFISEGYTVIAAVGRTASVSELPGHDRLEVHAVDLTDENAAGDFVRNAITAHGRIDAALLLVGGYAYGDLASTSGELLRKQFSLNFESAYFVARPLWEHFTANHYGRLVFIGSRTAIVPAQARHSLAYALSKNLLFTFAETLNQSVKGANITATVVAPSTIDTEANRKSMPDADPSKWVAPSQLADVLEFIVSDKGDPLRESVYKVYGNA
jgi:NAD(P)-dependent dehydrogenase (short-subunit alcohol dehydrogenase family)